VAFIFTNNRDYKERLWSLAIDRLKAAMGQVNVQLVAEKRGELRDAIKKTLIHDTAPLGIEVTDFQLTDLKYTDSFRAAVNNAAVQKANIESVEYQRQQAEKAALTAKIEAEGKANAQRAQAAGAADGAASAGHRRGQGHPVARRSAGGGNPGAGRRTQGKLQPGRTSAR
jgi:regulator of protease activity HflC (stomatin/prohibitin superfamily)